MPGLVQPCRRATLQGSNLAHSLKSSRPDSCFRRRTRWSLQSHRRHDQGQAKTHQPRQAHKPGLPRAPNFAVKSTASHQCQSGRIVDPVPSLRHFAAPGLQFREDACLVLRQHVGADFVDAQTRGDGAGGARVVAGRQDAAKARSCRALREADLVLLIGPAMQSMSAKWPSGTTNITVSPATRRMFRSACPDLRQDCDHRRVWRCVGTERHDPVGTGFRLI